jgi:helicase
MRRADAPASLGRGLGEILEAIHRGNDKDLAEAAATLEDLSDGGRLTRANEPLVLAMAGLAYDASGETEKAKRPYRKLLLSSMPMNFSEGQWPEVFSRYFTNSMACFGLRDFKNLGANVSKAFEISKATGGAPRVSGSEEGTLTALILLDIFLTYDEIVKGKASLETLSQKAKEAAGSTITLDASPWATIINNLCARTVAAALSRSIFSLEIDDSIRKRLIERGVVELWPPQVDAVKNGVFKGRNLVYSTPAGSGKSFLAYAATGDSLPGSMTVYLVPTRTLAEESYKRLGQIVGTGLARVAISTRERTDFDDHLDDYSVMVSTYEKFTALVRKSKIIETRLKRVIIDEAHTLSKEDRGIPLELALTELKSLKGQEDPQVITLSGMLRERDARDFSDWVGAALVRSDWKPLPVDERILAPGIMLHKDRGEEETTVSTNKSASFAGQREDLTKKLVLSEVIAKGQCMVAIESRKGAEDLASKISDFLNEPLIKLQTDPYLVDSRNGLDSIRRSILESEPALTSSAKKLNEFLQNGVAFHHAGLPRRFRTLIEKGINDGHIRVIVTTTTFEAGVNLPISHVIFPFPRGRNNNNPMEINTYRNLAGRAGRAGFDRRGTSTLIALSSLEAGKYRDHYFIEEGEPLTSALSTLMRRRPEARSEVQAQLLDMSCRTKPTATSFRDFARQTWFWRNLNSLDRTTFEGHLATELKKLHVYGFVSTTPSGEIEATTVGRIANRSVLTPLSVKNILDKTRKVIDSKKTGEEFDLLVLGLVALPFEVMGNDKEVEDVKPDKSTAFLETVITLDTGIWEKVQRIEMARKYATVLRYWIDKLTIDEVLSKCGLDPSSDAALLEELLPRDAYWVLSTIAGLPKEAIRMSDAQRKRIRELAEYCKVGASDPLVTELLNKGYRQMGRDTAIRMAGLLASRRKNLADLIEEDLIGLFPENVETARLLYHEISTSRKRDG